MENHWMMVLHSLIIGIVLWALMLFVLKQKNEVAERRSILIAAVALIYMILFGHGLPTKLNKI
jgi:predicted neutral ceramidase superfamily lipid hydrolase